jgi:hypothetical protein
MTRSSLSNDATPSVLDRALQVLAQGRVYALGNAAGSLLAQFHREKDRLTRRRAAVALLGFGEKLVALLSRRLNAADRTRLEETAETLALAALNEPELAPETTARALHLARLCADRLALPQAHKRLTNLVYLGLRAPAGGAVERHLLARWESLFPAALFHESCRPFPLLSVEAEDALTYLLREAAASKRLAWTDAGRRATRFALGATSPLRVPEKRRLIVALLPFLPDNIQAEALDRFLDLARQSPADVLHQMPGLAPYVVAGSRADEALTALWTSLAAGRNDPALLTHAAAVAKAGQGRRTKLTAAARVTRQALLADLLHRDVFALLMTARDPASPMRALLAVKTQTLCRALRAQNLPLKNVKKALSLVRTLTRNPRRCARLDRQLTRLDGPLPARPNPRDWDRFASEIAHLHPDA